MQYWKPRCCHGVLTMTRHRQTRVAVGNSREQLPQSLECRRNSIKATTTCVIVIICLQLACPTNWTISYLAKVTDIPKHLVLVWPPELVTWGWRLEQATKLVFVTTESLLHTLVSQQRIFHHLNQWCLSAQMDDLCHRVSREGRKSPTFGTWWPHHCQAQETTMVRSLSTLSTRHEKRGILCYTNAWSLMLIVDQMVLWLSLLEHWGNVWSTYPSVSISTLNMIITASIATWMQVWSSLLHKKRIIFCSW